MINRDCFGGDSWCLRESELDHEVLANAESIFALSNGHIGLRGNLEEGEPRGIPGTYLNSFYETWELPYAEAAYGNPEAGQRLLNVTDGKVIRLLVDDEPFDIRYGELRSHERKLDLRAGVLKREVDWVSPARQAVRISSVRLVSLAHRSIAAILYEVEPVDEGATVVVQSELVANEPIPHEKNGDPRAGAAVMNALVPEYHATRDARATLAHRTRASGLLMAASMDHVLETSDGHAGDCEANENLGRFTVASRLEPGQKLRLVKLIAYGWSSQRTVPELRDQVEAALASAKMVGWQGLVDDQREYLDEFWERADIEVDGDPELQQALRFAHFHLLQATARAEKRAIPAKGLTGTGYDGHTFWDTETFVLTSLSYHLPEPVRDALLWRHATLDLARERAKTLGLQGAAFPWRTIRGQECSGYWPAGTAAFHVNADIAHAVLSYVDGTGDREFEAGAGLELLVETARLWHSLGNFDGAGRFRIDGVTGPDEYSALADNNVYTNLMAQRNLRGAASAAERHPERARELGVSTEEVAAWHDAAAKVFVPYDRSLGVHPQSAGFTEHEVWNFEETRDDQYPLFLHFPYFDLYRKQVVKQADLVLAMFLRTDAFTAEEKARNFDYYEPLTVRDSSLSACVQAIVAAEVGHLDLAYDYFAEAALLDLDDLHNNTRDGLHLASLAGAVMAAIAGFGGVRQRKDGGLAFEPRLPRALPGIRFRFFFRERVIKLEIDHEKARYFLLDGGPIELVHHGEPITIAVDEPVERPMPPVEERPRPEQPAGRAPVSRSAMREEAESAAA
jgi:alpha,alpha-trehalose phosphorylase